MGKKSKIAVGIAVVAAVALGLSQANFSERSGEFRLGVIAPLSGDFAAVGENVVNGILTAEAVYERKTGNDVTVFVQDDGADASKGLSAYRKLSDTDKIDGLINVFTSTMDAIYLPAKSAGYPVMMEFFQANNVADDHVFQMTPGNDGTWEKYAAYIKGLGYDRSNLIIIHSKDAAQASFAQSFAGYYADKSSLYEASSDRNGLRTDAAKIAALKPTAIVLFMTPENGAILTKELLPLLSKSTKVFYDIQLVTGTQYYEDILGGLAKIDGAFTLAPEGEPNQEFIDAYRSLHGKDPGFLADFGYDTFMVYMENYDEDASVWTNNLREVDARGASGQIRFDENGVRLPDLVIKQVVGGKLKNIERLKL